MNIPQSPPAGDTELERILWEYKMDVQRFTPGADLLIDKATTATKAQLNAYILAEVMAAIGEDEEDVTAGKYADGAKVIRDNLRKEQRKAAQARFGGES